MIVNLAGTGKTALMRNMLASVDEESVVSTTINLNSYTDAPSLQPILENSLEKKSGLLFVVQSIKGYFTVI